MANKVTIELRPYDVLVIRQFLRSFINDDNKHIPEYAAIHEAVNNYESQIYKKITGSQLDDAIVEMNVNLVAGRQPKKV
jgi:hypothetical protein